MNTETWYVMEDGSCGDPREIAKGADGILRHKDGRAVAYAPHGPRSRNIDPGEVKAKLAAAADAEKTKAAAARAVAKATVEASAEAEKTAAKAKDMKPEEPKLGYKTRDAKAE